MRERHDTTTERGLPDLKPGEHISRALLTAWTEGKVPEPLRRTLMGHLDACPACRRALAAGAGPARRVRDALEGQRLGRYLVERRVGEGGMGAVYLAKDSLTAKPVAIKVLLSHLSDDEANEQRFRVEVKALAAVSHRNVVALLDSGELPGGNGQFLVMELLEGEPLADRLKRELLPRDEVLDALVQACAGLEAVHRAGVLHRDLKPGNLFRCLDGTVKLIDFGLARDSNGTRVTAAGLLMGTVGFVAPELLDGETATVQSDLYALGVAAWRLLTRTDPFQGKNLQERIRVQLSMDAPRLRDALLDAPDALVAVMTEVLSKDPARRPPSAAELGRRFAAVLLPDADTLRLRTLGDEGAQPTIKVGALSGPTDPVGRPPRGAGRAGLKTTLNPPIDLSRRKKT